MKKEQILLVPYVEIQNANALSSAYTIGFPAMSAWMGAVHVLQRKLEETEFSHIKFSAMTVSCHNIELQTHRGENDYISSIIGTGNPLDKAGKRPSFIEEARCHLTVSLVVKCENFGFTEADDFTKKINQLIKGGLKIAGGDILSNRKPQLLAVYDQQSFNMLKAKLMPGHCLKERRDLMIDSMEQGQDAIDSLLDSLIRSSVCEKTESGEVTWQPTKRKQKGWIVPVSAGYQGISKLGKAQNQRDENTPHRFAESIVTLGEFLMPFRFETLDELLWHYHTDLENNLYLCQQLQPKN